MVLDCSNQIFGVIAGSDFDERDPKSSAHLPLPGISLERLLPSALTAEEVDWLIMLYPLVFDSDAPFRNPDIKMLSAQSRWGPVCNHRRQWPNSRVDEVEHFPFRDPSLPNSMLTQFSSSCVLRIPNVPSVSKIRKQSQ